MQTRKSSRSWFAALALALLCAPAARALEPGSPAPELELPTAEGSFKLDKFRGSVVYVDFWASWCVPCRQSFPWMNAMQTKFAGKGLKIVAVNLDADSRDSKRFLAAVAANFDIAYDPKGVSARRYEVKGMPSSVLIGRDGRVVLQHIGFNESSRVKLEEVIQSVVEGRL